MTLCSESMSLSAASTNARTPAEETPWDSGAARGRSAAAHGDAAMTRNVTTESDRMVWPRDERLGITRDRLPAPAAGCKCPTRYARDVGRSWFAPGLTSRGPRPPATEDDDARDTRHSTRRGLRTGYRR